MRGRGVWWYMCAVGLGCDGSRGRDTHTTQCVQPGVIESYNMCCVAGVCWEEVWVGGRREGGCDVQAGVWEGRGRCGWWGEGGCCAVCVRC